MTIKTKRKGKAMTQDDAVLDLAYRIEAMEPYKRALVLQHMDRQLRRFPATAKPSRRLHGCQPTALAQEALVTPG